MAVEIGTASNARDLVSKLEKFLTTNPELVQANQAWEVIKDSDGDKVVDVDETYDDMYDEEEDVKSDGCIVDVSSGMVSMVRIRLLYQWRCTLMRSTKLHLYAHGMLHKMMQPKEISTYFAEVKFGNIFTAIPLKNESMNYWFVANGRRFIIVVKVEQYYLSMYCWVYVAIWD